MILPFAAMAGGFFLIFRGLRVFGCKSVSFSADFTTCYSNDLGAMSGAVAGTGLIVVGAVIFFVAMVRVSTVK